MSGWQIAGLAFCLTAPEIQLRKIPTNRPQPAAIYQPLHELWHVGTAMAPPESDILITMRQIQRAMSHGTIGRVIAPSLTTNSYLL